ncbi:DMT family transporter [Bacillus salitolerans]|uniref:DMT family transporter n=1 Tax=Bacillus salitolerans TaxID=1437434 RepID=A0ABW4LWE1_9BACI
MKPQMTKAYIALTIGVLSVSASAIFVKLAGAPSSITAFYRLFFSILIMFPLVFVKYKNELKRINRREWLFSIIAGVFLALHFVLWFESLRFTSIASSVVLVTMQPLFAFIGTYLFFQERFSLKTILSGTLAISGSVIISWGDFRISGLALWGDILALVACLLVTIYLLFGQHVRKQLSLITYTFIVYSVSTITLFIYAVLSGDSFFEYENEQWFYFVLLAIVPTLLGHTLFNYSLKWISTSIISVAILFEPIGASVLAYYVFHELPLIHQIFGGLIVIVGICLFLLFKRKETVKKDKKRPSDLH